MKNKKRKEKERMNEWNQSSYKPFEKSSRELKKERRKGVGVGSSVLWNDAFRYKLKKLILILPSKHK